jgi:hypothetical protein
VLGVLGLQLVVEGHADARNIAAPQRRFYTGWHRLSISGAVAGVLVAAFAVPALPLVRAPEVIEADERGRGRAALVPADRHFGVLGVLGHQLVTEEYPDARNIAVRCNLAGETEQRSC